MLAEMHQVWGGVRMSIRTIRPEYPDIIFRSKLEAQWTVVLDELGIPWEYEPHLFDLPSGKYLPDFRMMTGTQEEFWIEVKGPWPNAREFMVASEINLYVGPLLILSGDVPRQANGGSAWWFSKEDRQWHMLMPEEALIRMVFRGRDDRPERIGDRWDMALETVRVAEFGRADAA